MAQCLRKGWDVSWKVLAWRQACTYRRSPVHRGQRLTSVGRFKNHWARAVTETRYGVLRDKQGGP